MKLIFVDDERNFEDVTWIEYPEYSEVIVVRTYRDFVKEIDKLTTLKDVHISLDHDLQGFEYIIEYTGKDCANYLADKMLSKQLDYKNLFCYVHSKNPVGAANIKSLLNNVVQHLERESWYKVQVDFVNSELKVEYDPSKLKLKVIEKEST